MHFEVLIEDQSGKAALDILIPKILGEETVPESEKKHSFRIISYKGIGQLPPNLDKEPHPRNRCLLSNLPKMLTAYTKALSPDQAVMVVVDLDDRCLCEFRSELMTIQNQIREKNSNGAPDLRVKFCFAIEELEAWFLGDLKAIKAAYPHAKKLTDQPDQIVGTWEKLADIIHPGGPKSLKNNHAERGRQKSLWAKHIPRYMNIENNTSPSFCYFRDQLQKLCYAPLTCP